jgi:putative chitinase
VKDRVERGIVGRNTRKRVLGDLLCTLLALLDAPGRFDCAQLAHESMSLKFMEEIADGSAYGGRLDLGNVERGDGVKFKGHGPIQITGRENHRLCGLALKVDLIANPKLLTQPTIGCRAAAWFWTTLKGLNQLADEDKFGTITKKINGGYNHLDERIAHWLIARKVLGL